MIKLIRGFFAFVGFFYMEYREKNIALWFLSVCAMVQDHGCRMKLPWGFSSFWRINRQKGTFLFCTPAANTKKHEYISIPAFPERLRDRVAGAFIKCCDNVVSPLKTAAPVNVGGATLWGKNLIMVNMSRSFSGNPLKTVTDFFRRFPKIINHDHQTGHVSFPPGSSEYLPPPSSGEETLSGPPVFLLAHLKKIFFPIIHRKESNRQKKFVQPGIDFFPGRLPDFHWVTTGQVGFSDMGPTLSLISHKTAKNGIPAVRTIAFDKIIWKMSKFFKNFIGSAVVFSSSS
ncbi:hypothetical protein SAMN02746065_101363 [Desulfocicer vacuolatum DSM 3385]|uniref:Uncharacterized protein n=1 Tax=Desulfocicer vacuolatum DSM 3385 TaxID=1121400 RepID=A0A1W1YUZ4_9BACT|nr:hypothetical protein [Desulfocicer vacuolatum]SMC39548.1 hypothetical protein SAMN02746065_101363 [Desulfocicer vacuolatum DSM 3385]